MELQGAELKQGKLAKFLLWLHDYFQWLEMSGSGGCYCSVAQSYLTLCDPVDCSLPGSSAGDQPRLIQGIQRRDGVGEDQETIA